jgi:serine/threonine-protein kinase
MGEVFLAEQRSLKRKVALKILKAELAASIDSLTRFKAEAEAVARLAHGNIVQVYAVGAVNGVHYMALEYVDGLNLRDYLAKKGPPGVPQTLSIMRQVAAALQRAGELGIVHRDIKPENILLSRKGEVKVADFGLSRCFEPSATAVTLTQTGITLGTPLYMSPEQVEGKQLDPRTDIYSFGITCYQMLAGNPPFVGQTAFEVALRHVQSEPASLASLRPDLPAALCTVVHKMMAKQPEQRFQSGRELLREVNRLRESLSNGNLSSIESAAAASTSNLAGSGPKAALEATMTSAARSWKLGLAIAALLLALFVGMGFGLRSRKPAAVPFISQAPQTTEPISEPLSFDQRREQFLRAAAEEYADTRDPNQALLAIGSCLELGLFYLDRARWADADQFFVGLTERAGSPRVFMLLGKLGHAVVLAFKDQAQESCETFLQVLNNREQVRGLLNRNPRFLEMIARALNHDAANLEAAKKSLPAALEELRKPQPLSAPKPAVPPTPEPRKNAKP